MADNDFTSEMPLKKCAKCGVEKPKTAEYFHRSKKEADGLHYYCKSCISTYQKKLRINGIAPSTEERRDLIEQGKKRCARCNGEYPASLEYFPANEGGSFGVHSICRRCHTVKGKEYRQTPTGKRSAKKCADKYRASGKRSMWENEYKRNRRATDPEFAERERETDRKRNQTEKRKQQRKNRYHSEWGRLLHNLAIQRRRARKKSLPDTFTADHFTKMMQYWNRCCAYCNKPLSKLHCDHYIPLKELNCPGTIPANILPSCPNCNSSKRASMPEVWIQKRFKERSGSIIKRIQDYFDQL